VALGRELAAGLRRGGLVWLSGPLGAGKTLLAKAILAALGVAPDEVTSPTFTLVNPHRSADASAPPIYHCDLYRLRAGEDLESLGLEELVGSGALLLVEWGERMGDAYGPPDLVIELEDLGGDERRVRLRSAAG
jgi:tRNA threonylcarbamoyladenosine biosynthesis protein TsaE